MIEFIRSIEIYLSTQINLQQKKTYSDFYIIFTHNYIHTNIHIHTHTYTHNKNYRHNETITNTMKHIITITNKDMHKCTHKDTKTHTHKDMHADTHNFSDRITLSQIETETVKYTKKINKNW